MAGHDGHSHHHHRSSITPEPSDQGSAHPNTALSGATSPSSTPALTAPSSARDSGSFSNVQPAHHSSLSKGALIGIIVGAVGGTVLLALVLFFVWRRARASLSGQHRAESEQYATVDQKMRMVHLPTHAPSGWDGRSTSHGSSPSASTLHLTSLHKESNRSLRRPTTAETLLQTPSTAVGGWDASAMHPPITPSAPYPARPQSIRPSTADAVPVQSMASASWGPPIASHARSQSFTPSSVALAPIAASPFPSLMLQSGADPHLPRTTAPHLSPGVHVPLRAGDTSLTPSAALDGFYTPRSHTRSHSLRPPTAETLPSPITPVGWEAQSLMSHGPPVSPAAASYEGLWQALHAQGGNSNLRPPEAARDPVSDRTMPTSPTRPTARRERSSESLHRKSQSSLRPGSAGREGRGTTLTTPPASPSSPSSSHHRHARGRSLHKKASASSLRSRSVTPAGHEALVSAPPTPSPIGWQQQPRGSPNLRNVYDEGPPPQENTSRWSGSTAEENNGLWRRSFVPQKRR